MTKRDLIYIWHALNYLAIAQRNVLSELLKLGNWLPLRVSLIAFSLKLSLTFSKKGTSGIRSPIITPKGKFLSDVMELENDYSFNIINYNSPGATGAPAYSAFIVKKLQEKGILDFKQIEKQSIWKFENVLNQA